jgi:hypothetical protein
MEPYYHDPLCDRLDDVERSAESWLDHRTTMFVPDGELMDPLAHRLGELESGIERTTVPPPGWPALFVDPTAGMQPPTVGALPLMPRSPDPPLPERGEVLGRVEMRPPSAARPYFAREGLSREGYRPHVGSSTGALGRYSIPTRWCLEQEGEVEESTCYDCPLWDDHGAGFEECHHDWLKRQHQEDESEE